MNPLESGYPGNPRPLVDVVGQPSIQRAADAAKEFELTLLSKQIWPAGDALLALRKAADWSVGEAWAWKDGTKRPPDQAAFESAMLLALDIV